jgi:hypothetical protein
VRIGHRPSVPPAFMTQLGAIGEKLLRLTALGLGLADIDPFTSLTVDGWHHMRVLRFPASSAQTSRGIGAHTDYGMLVIAAQDEVGGLYVRPPVEGERRNRNWLETESTAGLFEIAHIVLNHDMRGFPQHWYAWRRVIALLSGCRLNCPDLRGFGRRASAARPGGVTSTRRQANCQPIRFHCHRNQASATIPVNSVTW